MSKLLISLALFGVLSTAMARMGLGMWESTSEQENLVEFFKALHGEERATAMFAKNSKIMTGWHYDDHADYVHHIIKIMPANITTLFSFRPGKKGVVAWGLDIVEYSFESEAEGETAAIHGKFKLKGSDKSWTKDWEFQENGDLKVTAKIKDITAKITFRPTLSPRAQGLWEATTEGKNIEKLDQVFKFKKAPPKEEKYRVCVHREGDHYVKQMNASTGNHKYDFKINKPSEVTFSDKKMKSITSYDVALDMSKTTVTQDGEDVEITYTYDNRGAYGTYKKGDVEVQRFYRRLIPEELLGKFKFAGKEVNADAFRKVLTGDDNTKQNIAAAQKIHLQAKEDKYLMNVTYGSGKTVDYSFKLGELEHTIGPNGTHIDHMWQFNTKWHRNVLEGHLFTTDQPNHYIHVHYEFENSNDLVLTYHLDHVVAKRWFKKE